MKWKLLFWKLFHRRKWENIIDFRYQVRKFIQSFKT